MMKIGILASSLLKNVFDSFTRTTSGSLGTSTSGASWTGLKGTWYATGSQARSDDAGSNYSLASVAIGTDTTTSADVSGGVGVAFWVSDAGSWWAAVPFYTQTTNSTCTSGACSGTESYSYLVSNCNNGACSGTETYTTTSSNCPNGACSGNYVVESSNCASGACSGTEPYTVVCQCTDNIICQYSFGTGFFAASQCAAINGTYSSANGGTCCFSDGLSSTCNSGACSGTEIRQMQCICSYDNINCSCTTTTNVRSCSCSTQTGTRSCSCTSTQSYFLRLLRSVGGTVSTVTSDVSLGSAATAVKVITSGNTITAQAYSNSAMTATLGNALIHTASSPTRGPSTGLVKTPVPFSQGSTADNFSSGA